MPIPASPLIPTIWPWPRIADSRRLQRSSISRWRPTNVATCLPRTLDPRPARTKTRPSTPPAKSSSSKRRSRNGAAASVTRTDPGSPRSTSADSTSTAFCLASMASSVTCGACPTRHCARWIPTVTAGARGSSGRARAAAFWIAMAACAARLGASSVASSPNAATTPVGLMPSMRPPKLVTFSTRTPSARLASRGSSDSGARVSVALKSVTRRRSHRSAAGTAGAGAPGGATGGRGAGRGTRRGTDGAGTPLLRPYFSMRARSVLREIPRSAAEREMFQRVWRSTSATRSRTASSSEPVSTRSLSRSFPRIVLESPSISAVTSGSGDKSVTRSMRLASSRTLPGQGYARSAACAAAVSVLGGTP